MKYSRRSTGSGRKAPSKWKGKDFDSLALWWDQQGKTALGLTIEIIQQASKDLNQNAIAQQQKSSRGVEIA